MEQVRLLGHEPDDIAERLEGHLAQVVAVDLDRPAVDVVQARDEVGRRGLARAGRADQCDQLPGCRLEVDPLEGEPRGGALERSRLIEGRTRTDGIERGSLGGALIGDLDRKGGRIRGRACLEHGDPGLLGLVDPSASSVASLPGGESCTIPPTASRPPSPVKAPSSAAAARGGGGG